VDLKADVTVRQHSNHFDARIAFTASVSPDGGVLLFDVYDPTGVATFGDPTRRPTAKASAVLAIQTTNLVHWLAERAQALPVARRGVGRCGSAPGRTLRRPNS
jgi:hypothetical protein